MTYTNYFHEGMCVGLAGQGGVYEKCECFQLVEKDGDCRSCLKLVAFRARGVISLNELCSELNLREVKNDS